MLNFTKKTPHHIDTKMFRYYIEAIDRTLGSDWFQVGEAAPGDRKVEMVENMIDMTRDALADVDTATGAQAQIQVQGEGLQQAGAVPTLRDERR